jgi:hypothetical protein
MTMTTMDDLEVERHRCEVRYVIALRIKSRDEAMEYLSLVREKRKDKAARLEKDVIDQWNKGNRGVKGDWYE